jgi:hypothetical protein
VAAAAPPVAPVASSTGYATAPSFLSDPIAAVSNSISNSVSNALNNPAQTLTNIAVSQIPVVGALNTISGVVGGPTIGSALFGKDTTAPAATTTTTTQAPADQIALATPDDYTKGTDAATPSTGGGGATSTTGGGGTPPVRIPNAPSIRQMAALPTDLTRYGEIGPEAEFYKPKVARGGYFDADLYFAEGGPVTSPNPPTQTMLSPMPTMAYTDGQGSVGAVAAPPALSGYDMVGSDAPHASPTAPAPAAAAPSFMPPLQRAATYNTNASPVAAPISQNPNLGYSLGVPPLTGLKG